MRRRSRSISIALVFVIIALSTTSLLAQGVVPVNGNFASGLTGWVSDTGVFYFGGGYDGNGFAGFTAPWYGLRSTPFTPSTGSVATFYAACLPSCSSTVKISTYDYTDQIYRAGAEFTVNNTWQAFTYNLSFLAGHRIMITLYSGSTSSSSMVSVDAVSVTSATNAVSDWYTGAFSSTAHHWILDGNSYDAGTGNPAGSLRGGGWSYSYPVAIYAGTWQLQYKGSGSFDLTLYDFSNGSTPSTIIPWLSRSASDWQTITFDLSTFVGHTATFTIHADSGIYIDNVCPQSGCDTVLYTPTPSPTTSGGGGGGGSGGATVVVNVPTIDWTQFPTPAPFPTLVQVHFGNTPQPVFLTTPIVFPTPLYGKDTPIPILLPSPTPSPTAMRVSQMQPPQGVPAAYPTTNFANAQSYTPLAFGGNAPEAQLLDFNIAAMDFDFPIDLHPVFDVAVTFRFHYTYPERFIFGGVDILGPLYMLGLAFLGTFIVRRIQKK